LKKCIQIIKNKINLKSIWVNKNLDFKIDNFYNKTLIKMT
jgi:hypothetical protein